MKVFLVIADGGDGFASIEFWDQNPLDILEETDPETYGYNEGFALELDIAEMPKYRTLNKVSQIQLEEV